MIFRAGSTVSKHDAEAEVLRMSISKGMRANKADLLDFDFTGDSLRMTAAYCRRITMKEAILDALVTLQMHENQSFVIGTKVCCAFSLNPRGLVNPARVIDPGSAHMKMASM